MPTCLYLRGCPGSGKKTVAEILARDLGWPLVWVHNFDAVYKAIGEHRVPGLTDRLMFSVARYLMDQKRDLIVVRPSRETWGMKDIYNSSRGGFRFVPVQLTARYETLARRVQERFGQSPFRITTREALDEYLAARPAEAWPGETIIETDDLQPEQVAEQIKGLL